MWASLFTAVTEFATTITILFGALGKFAKAVDHIGEVAEGSAGLLADESKFKRETRRRELLAQQQLALAAPSAPATAAAQP